MFKAIKEFFTGKPVQEPVATPKAEEAPYKIEAPVVAEAAPAAKKPAAPRAKKPAAKSAVRRAAAKKPTPTP